MKGLELKNKLQLGHLKTVKALQREKRIYMTLERFTSCIIILFVIHNNYYKYYDDFATINFIHNYNYAIIIYIHINFIHNYNL